MYILKDIVYCIIILKHSDVILYSKLAIEKKEILATPTTQVKFYLCSTTLSF